MSQDILDWILDRLHEKPQSAGDLLMLLQPNADYGKDSWGRPARYTLRQLNRMRYHLRALADAGKIVSDGGPFRQWRIAQEQPRRRYDDAQVLMWWRLYEDDELALWEISELLDVPTAVIHLAFRAWGIPFRKSDRGLSYSGSGYSRAKAVEPGYADLGSYHWIPPVAEQSKWERKHTWASILEASIRGEWDNEPRVVTSDPSRVSRHGKIRYPQSARERWQNRMCGPRERAQIRLLMRYAGILPLR